MYFCTVVDEEDDDVAVAYRRLLESQLERDYEEYKSRREVKTKRFKQGIDCGCRAVSSRSRLNRILTSTSTRYSFTTPDIPSQPRIFPHNLDMPSQPRICPHSPGYSLTTPDIPSQPRIFPHNLDIPSTPDISSLPRISV